MKYIITGLHASGKQHVVDILKSLNIKCGKQFTSNQYPDEKYYVIENHVYDINEVNKIFENNAYIFLHEYPGMQYSSIKHFIGLSKYEFENNDVFIMSPDQILKIIPNTIKEPVCFIWMDNTKNNRRTRFIEENRTYDFNDRENVEKQDISSFVKTIYGFNNNSNVLYFTNEEPERIAAIIYSLITYPNLFELYKKSFV